MTRALRLGTRGSALALAQAGAVAAAIETALHRRVELVRISTAGDASTAAIAQLGGTGVFVAAVRDALSAGEVDLAVHSYKDLPTAAAAGLTIAAVPAREDPRDVLVARDRLTLGELPVGSRVGTGAPRRIAQLRALGLGLEVVPMRGNVDSRLAAVSAGRFDAVVLARAGLARLGRLAAVTQTLDPLQMLPAPAQGALAVECRVDDDLAGSLSVLDHADTRVAVTTERALLAALAAGCTAPVGAYAEIAEGDDGLEIFVRAVVAALDGTADIRRAATGPVEAPAELGRRLAAEMLDRGAAEMLDRGAAELLDPREGPHSAGSGPRLGHEGAVGSIIPAGPLSTSGSRAHE